jgi:16S rRNA (adenine1518-N6/adenine1519-N6)-dimethyltransferase
MDFRPSKRLGQNFLTDRNILAQEAEAAGLGKNDVVLEIGPGDGRLTRLLAEKAGKIVAIEKDKRLEKFLADLPENVEIIFGDAAKMELPAFNKVVSNIPYSISSKITFILLERGFDVAVLSFQKEFAERMTAKPGSKEWGRLGATVSFLAEVELLRTIPAGAFFPKPKVDSALVRIVPLGKPADWLRIKRAIDALFIHPGKTVRAALKGKKVPEELASRRVRSLGKGDITRLALSCF